MDLNGYLISIKLNILPLDSYDLLIGMDWLEQQKSIVKCLENIMSCTNSQEKYFLIRGKQKEVFVRQITTLQLKRTTMKGFQFYMLHVEEDG